MAPSPKRARTEVTKPQQRRAATLLAEARELETAAGGATRWTCSTTLPGGLLARAETGPAPGSGCGPARAGPGRAGQRHGAVKVLVGAGIGRTVSREQLAAAG